LLIFVLCPEGGYSDGYGSGYGGGSGGWGQGGGYGNGYSSGMDNKSFVGNLFYGFVIIIAV
jgi:hypothetical protein